MEFRVLGDLEAAAGGSRLVLGLPSDQKVFGLLLVSAGRVVPLPRLVNAVWEDSPPPTAAKQVRNAVSRLRRLLTDAGAPCLIETRGGGYLIALNGAALDLEDFEAKVAQGDAAASADRPDEAARLLCGALDLWRGRLLAGMEGGIFRGVAAVWEERRCAVAERYHDHQLALGRHREAVAEFARFAHEHPLREKPVAQLMIALYRCGRQADALALYSDTRGRLAADLGLDPGLELQRLHQQVLTADPALAPPQAGDDEHRSAAGQSAAARVPRQLPGAVRHFTGRCEELKALAELLGQMNVARGTVVISAIDGTAGVGKTALAVYWAHQVAGHFPDGQLYVNLRGFDPEAPPMEPAEAIRGFLDAYEVPVAAIPASPDAQAASYRSLMAGKRALIVLDNAHDPAQVRPLLPGSPGCLAVVTSRSQLTGLIIDGAQPVTLDLFSPKEARAFLARRLGAERITTEPGAVTELIDLCARLPLALSIVAARALRQPGLPLAALAAQLRDTARRLDELDSGDAATGVRPVLSWSYQSLTAEAARMFRLLAVHPGPDTSAAAAASLAGVPHVQARSALAELTRANLLTEPVPDRFAFHDLLRAYAAEQARAVDSDADRRAAVHRMLDHYLHTAYAATRRLNPARDPIGLDPTVHGVAPEQLAGQTDALAWFAAERQVMLAVIALAAVEGFDAHAWKIAWAISTLLERQGHWSDETAAQRTALIAAQRQGDSIGEAHAHRALGLASARLGACDEAVRHLRQALALSERGGNQSDIARGHLALGFAFVKQGSHSEALGHARQALDLYTAVGDRGGQALALNGAAWCLANMDDIPQALTYGERALKLHYELGDRGNQGEVLDTLGYIHYRAGRFGQAVDHYQRALDLCRQLGERCIEAEVLKHIGDAHQSSGDVTLALESWQQAQVILAELERMSRPS